MVFHLFQANFQGYKKDVLRLQKGRNYKTKTGRFIFRFTGLFSVFPSKATKTTCDELKKPPAGGSCSLYY